MVKKNKLVLAVVLILILFSGLALLRHGGTEESARQGDEAEQVRSNAAGPYAGEVTDGRSFGGVLATEQAKSPSPPSSLTHRFNRLLDGIADRCSQSREWVSDHVISGHRMLTDRGGEASLLDVAEGWYEAVQGPGSSNCVSTLSALLVTLERGG